MFPRRSSRPVLLAAGLAMVLTGCSQAVSAAVDSAARRTGEGVGEAVGQRIGEAAGAALAARMPSVWTPDLTAFYVSWMFSLAFHSGSYAVEPRAYQPGDWTRWRFLDADEELPPTMERAFLATRDDGAEWWRVRWVAQYVEDGRTATDTLILEGLFSPDGSELIRLRGKFPNEPEARELAVQQGTFGYVKPMELTPESIDGATVGTARLQVPAGTFQARHVRYGTMHGTLEWWLSDDVPGGLVRYRAASPDEDDDETWTLELEAFGRDARSLLGVT